MIRDPICGIPVDPDATPPDLKMTIRGEVYTFCSIRCRLTFEEEKLPFILRTRTPRLSDTLKERRAGARADATTATRPVAHAQRKSRRSPG
jgi:YHS domain-containing protein